MIPRDFLTTKYCYLEVEKSPGNITRRFHNRRLSLPGYCYEKHYFCEYLRKNEKKFKIFWDVDLGPRYYGFMREKKPEL